MTGDTQSAMKSYLKEAADSPAHWYQAGQIAFRTTSRGIAANPYIAEGLTGRTKINEHLYWHASNRNGPEWATDYLGAPCAISVIFGHYDFTTAVKSDHCSMRKARMSRTDFGNQERVRND